MKYPFSIFLLSFCSLSAYAQPGAIALPKLIETFMLKSTDVPEWSMGAGASTPQLSWVSSGVEGRPKCGSYESCRRGGARIQLNGKEMQHLRKKLEPISWELFMYSTSPEKFGPETLSISPSCDTVQCAFDFKKAMGESGLTLKQVCKAGLPSFSQTAYEISKAGRRTHVVVSENLGSGGASTSLTLYFQAPADPKELCAEAKNNE